MNLIKQWREESGYSYNFIADLLGVSTAKTQRYENGQEVEPEVLKLLKDIYRLDRLIAQAPNDIILLKYELSQLTGFSIEEFDKAKDWGERKLERKALKSLPMEPTNLRVVTLKNLENLRKNGYVSVYRPNINYDSKEVDAEISRKTYNAKRKKEIWEEKIRLNA